MIDSNHILTFFVKITYFKLPYITYNIARVFYNVVFSTYLRSNDAEKRVWYINCCPPYFRVLIYLELKVKRSFLRIWYLDIFSQIVFNPLKLLTTQQLSFCTDQWWGITTKDNIYIDMQAGINFEVLRKSAISTISVVRMAFYPLDCC